LPSISVCNDPTVFPDARETHNAYNRARRYDECKFLHAPALCIHARYRCMTTMNALNRRMYRSDSLIARMPHLWIRLFPQIAFLRKNRLIIQVCTDTLSQASV